MSNIVKPGSFYKEISTGKFVVVEQVFLQKYYWSNPPKEDIVVEYAYVVPTSDVVKPTLDTIQDLSDQSMIEYENEDRHTDEQLSESDFLKQFIK